MIMSNLLRDTPVLAIDRILCPVDFSEASQHAIEHALAIARWSGAAVSALHVCRSDVRAGHQRVPARVLTIRMSK